MFRTVLIKKASKLQSIQGYMVAYDGEEEHKVFLDDISSLVIEATGSVVTVPLMIDLISRNVSVILCDRKHQPIGILSGLNSHHMNSGNLYKQLEWQEERSKELWKRIVRHKIKMQLKVMRLFETDNTELMEKYFMDVESGDVTNREALAAKIHFNEIFGKSFSRHEETAVNGMLNYGYAIILGCVNREIVSSGYLTQLGIFHRGKTNPFNLSSDFMEPFRPIVDMLVKLSITMKDPRKAVRKVLTKQMLYNNERRHVDDVIRLYVMQAIRFMNNETDSEPDLDLLGLDDYKDDEGNAADYYV